MFGPRGKWATWELNVEGTQYLVTEDYITSGVFKTAFNTERLNFPHLWYPSPRIYRSPHFSCSASPGIKVLGVRSRNRMQCNNFLWCLSLATKVTKNCSPKQAVAFLLNIFYFGLYRPFTTTFLTCIVMYNLASLISIDRFSLNMCELFLPRAIRLSF